MPVPTSYTNPTGKQNVLTSFNNWLVTNVPTAGAADFVYDFLAEPSTPQIFAQVSVTELTYFDPGISAFGMNIFPASNYPAVTPAKNGTGMCMMVQIEIKADAGVNKSAKQAVYKIRDRFKRALTLAGYSDDEAPGVPLVAPILVLDYGVIPPGDTGIIAHVPVERDNGLQENYIGPDEGTPNIHTMRLLALLEWYELN